ncbi:MAG: TIGR02186 family protein [Xanthobacteraceae bacterium]
MRRALFFGAMLLLLMSPFAAGAAERLVATLSTQRVLINSVFSGAELVLFGAIERDANAPARRFGYDIAVIVSGPAQSLLTLRKQRVVGIWVNVESRTFVDVPSYLAIYANRPFDQIAKPEVLRRLHIGFDNTILRQRIGPDLADVVREDAFRQAFLRLKVDRHLYLESSKAVTFLAPTLFRASVPLPADASVGSYSVDVMLFADGALITRTTSAFEILKVGFERFVVTAARDYGLLYGIVTVMMALATGWFASIVFRRD